MKVPVKLTRNGTATSLELALQPSPVRPAAVTSADLTWRKLGLRLQPVGPEAVAKVNPLLHGGMLVLEVAPGSASATAGVQKGDVLVGLHNFETISHDNVAFVLNHKDFASFLPLRFFVARDGKLREGWINSVP